MIELNAEQSSALQAIKSFLRDDDIDAFILRGSAGTGKTTLIARLIEALDEMNLSCALMAPTGRAARIIGNKIGQIAGDSSYGSSTIHKEIYSSPKVSVNENAEAENDPGVRLVFPLKTDEPTASLFVIDESSMVGDKEQSGDFMQFGSGRLLSDVVQFVRAKRPGRTERPLTKLLFVGDPAQLPPVGDNISPALSDEYLAREFGLRVASFELRTVMRQAQGSAILARAREIRDAIEARRFNRFSLTSKLEDIQRADVRQAVDLVEKGIRDRDSSVVVVHSNSIALEYNRTIRERRWGHAGMPIQIGETLLVNKNKPPFSNGDLVRVMKVGAEPKTIVVPLRGGHRVDLSFREVSLAFRDTDGTIVKHDTLVLENLLDAPGRQLSALEQRALLVDFRMRHPHLRPASEEFQRTIRDDAYFNALQVKYGYALTCHKAQGGEWKTVVVDFDGFGDPRNEHFYRWAYTAITRAAERLVLINPPEFEPYNDEIWRGKDQESAIAEGASRDPSGDPDWDRFSFSSSVAPLIEVHQKLRSAWYARGITIDQLRHLDYCERYTLTREGKRASVQYHYNGQFKISRSGEVPGSVSDRLLADDALAILGEVAGKKDAIQPDAFIQEFLDLMDRALAGSPIARTGVELSPYRLRVSVADASRRGDIDFSFNGKSTWTTAQEVGGPGRTNGLYEDVKRLMSADTVGNQ
ncbi:ATP-dependent DNA helicase [Novosphingobium panipatense]|uniref:UvrD-like helicase C-terminal domain-containing protein n=1 Tax=Novosphingobium panipatense TaxID=428991 RepID=A0ABY1Q9Q9_9SPHN|nr:AAA family ATPase [Novosphingobium panipatense]SMP60410.1 UvrD-like helicase C-terminal domain-containing protein [Novosphingobium panipatense]